MELMTADARYEKTWHQFLSALEKQSRLRLPPFLRSQHVYQRGFEKCYGCNDEDLFEKYEFDLLTRKALGLELLTDVTPSIDTYYLFRRRICEYEQKPEGEHPFPSLC